MYEKRLAMDNDHRLMEMAAYHETKGLTQGANPVEIHDRFSDFKRTIKKGSYTIDELEAKIYGLFGVVYEDPRAATLVPVPDPLVTLEQKEHEQRQDSSEERPK